MPAHWYSSSPCSALRAALRASSSEAAAFSLATRSPFLPIPAAAPHLAQPVAGQRGRASPRRRTLPGPRPLPTDREREGGATRPSPLPPSRRGRPMAMWAPRATPLPPPSPPPAGRSGAMAAQEQEADAELEALLESALGDFEKAPPSPGPGGSGSSGSSSSGQSSSSPGAGPRPPEEAAQDALFSSQEQFFQELFDGELASQATAEFEQAMRTLATEEPHLVEQFQKLSEAAGRVGSDPTSQQEFTSCLKETLSGLAKNANDLQNSTVAEEELAKTLEGLGLEDGEGEGGLLPLMQSIMQNLLSKDVLYPSLKEITEKYPEWLHSHRDSLPKEQYDKYREQHCIMGKICEQFEAERPTDSDTEHKARFELVLDLMQQLQDLGHPPKELAGESPPGLNFDMEGLNLPAAANAGGDQCRIM
ncbi:peroxisomal biogenesis factor 19 [Paroedura picta]|uniref:peroxisomal biogenesis factor 19 n=1 Tax=Paroedura picta TaxID=143630 RepID=UPI004056D2FA